MHRNRRVPEHNLTARRYYCNDSGEGIELSEWWYKTRKYRIAIAAIVGSGVLISNLETVPYTNRTHLTVVPKCLVRGLGRSSSYLTRKEFGQRILPSADPKSIRVHSILENIVGALELVWSDMEGLKWEVLVVDEPVVYTGAFVESAGTIVVYTSMLDRLKSDAEIASVIGHEVYVYIRYMHIYGIKILDFQYTYFQILFDLGTLVRASNG